MMKKILLGAAALSVMAAPAFAQSPAEVDLSASVGGACSAISAMGGVVSLGQLPLNGDGYLAGSVEGGEIWQAIPGGDFSALTSGSEVWCNTKGKVTVTGTALVHESLPVTDRGRTNDGFMRHIDLRINGFSFGGANGVSFGENGLNTGSSLDNATRSADRTSGGAFAGPVGGVAEMWLGDYIYNQGLARPLAGAYRAEWTFTVTPAA